MIFGGNYTREITVKYLVVKIEVFLDSLICPILDSLINVFLMDYLVGTCGFVYNICFEWVVIIIRNDIALELSIICEPTIRVCEYADFFCKVKFIVLYFNCIVVSGFICSGYFKCNVLLIKFKEWGNTCICIPLNRIYIPLFVKVQDIAIFMQEAI